MSTGKSAELWAALMNGEPGQNRDITSADVNNATRIKAEQTWGGRRLVEVHTEGEWRPLVLVQDDAEEGRE